MASGDQHQVIAWDPDTDQEVWRSPAPHVASALAFSPDGKTLATVSWDGMLRFSEAATGKLLRSLRGSKERLLTVAWSPSGKLLACGGDDGYISLWDVVTGNAIRRLQSARPQSPVSCGAFSPGGRFFVTGRDDGAMPLFEVATGTESHRLVGQHSWPVDMAFSPDGNLLATAHTDSSVRLWKVRTGKERRELAGHKNAVAAVAFSRDGWLLASGSEDGSVRVWETVTGRNVLCLKGHARGVTSVAFAPDGRRILSGGRDSTALIWDVTGLPRRAGAEQPLSLSQRATLWQQLAESDAAVAYRAVWRLVAAPRQAVQLLEEELIPVKGVTAEQLARLVDELDHHRFRVRQRASRQLEQLGAAAIPELSRRLADRPSLEMRRRVEKLLDKVDPLELPPRRLREVRALVVLEQVGTADARRVLRSLAGGASGAWLTEQAKAALQRLNRARVK